MKKQNNQGKFYSKTRNPRRWLKPLLFALTALVLIAVLCVSLFFMHNEKAEKDLRSLASQTQTTASLTETTAPTESAPETTAPTEATTVPTETEPPTILPQYAELYAQNPDLYGWVKIEDTKIDYPVMYTPGLPEKYLHTGFDGSNSYPGVPFIDINCQPDSQNLLIYGHNMPNGTMFRGLMKYQEKNYWEKHPTILFSTLYEEKEYEILAAFNDRVYYQRENVFKFYQFIDPATEEEFDAGIAQFKEKSLYDTGVDAEYGDHLITLITCAYHTDNGRFVVVAREKK